MIWRKIVSRKHFDGIGLALLLSCGHSVAVKSATKRGEADCGWCRILESRRDS